MSLQTATYCLKESPLCTMSETRQRYRHRQDGPWAWLVLFAVWSANVVTMGFAMTFGVLLPELREHFNKSRQSVAWVASIALSLSTLVGPFTGAMINRFGCRVVAVFGALTCTVSLIITSFAEQMEFMYFSYGVIYGFGSSGVVFVGFIVITKYFTKWKSFAIGMVSGGMGAGSLIFGPCLELLLSSVGWRWTFRVVAAISFVNVFLLCVYEPNEVEVDEQNRRCDNQQRKIFDCSVWKNYRFVLATVGISIVIFAKYIPIVHLAQFAKDLGISDKGAAKLYMFFGLATSISRPVSGMLCQIKRVRTMVVFLVSAFLSGIIYFLLPVLTSYQLLVMFSVLFGLLDGLFMTSMNIVALSTFKCPKKGTSAFGILLMCLSVSFGVGPPLAGLMADVYGSFNPAFYLSGASCILASLMLCFIPCIKAEEQNGKQLLQSDDLLLVYERETVL